MRLTIEPITVKAALKLVKTWHRKLPDLQGGLFAALAVIDGQTVGVGVAGNPARVWQGTGRIVISRIAAQASADNPRARNACSKLYGALCRAAEALGYREAWTYTLPEEPGDSLRGAGFEDVGLSDGGEHDRPSRRRKPAKRADPKRRWRRILRPNG